MSDSTGAIEKVEEEVKTLYEHFDRIDGDVSELKNSHVKCMMERRVSALETLTVSVIQENTKELATIRSLYQTLSHQFESFREDFNKVINVEKARFKFKTQTAIKTYFNLLRYVTGVSFLLYVLSNLKDTPSLDGHSLFTWVGIASLMFIFPENPVIPILSRLFGPRGINGKDGKS